MMHTCEYSMGSSPHNFKVYMSIYVQMCFSDCNQLIETGYVNIKFEQSQVMQIKSKANYTKP